jgi:hypothetical protein
VRLTYTSSPPETPPVTGLPPPPGRRTRKKLYLVLGIIAVAAVATGFGLVIFRPPSFRVTITSTPSGSGFVTVDGRSVTTPCDFLWQSGSIHNVTANSPASAESGVQYAYSSWSDGGSQSHTITINGSSIYRATFVTLIPLTYNYVPGEQMTYNLTENVTNTASPSPRQNWSETGTMTMDIVSFDGENYTINEETKTVLTLLLNSSSQTSSVTFAVNKTGYVPLVKSPASVQELYSWLGYFILAFEKNQAEAGETWQIPLNASNTGNSSVSLNGNLTETFSDIQNITVPAGTYRVFGVNVLGSTVAVVTNYPPNNSSATENFTIEGQVYLEYGTCRMIETNLQMSYSISQNGSSTNSSTSQQLELAKYIKN